MTSASTRARRVGRVVAGRTDWLALPLHVGARPHPECTVPADAPRWGLEVPTARLSPDVELSGPHLIVDDHPAMRAGSPPSCDEEEDIVVVGAATGGRQMWRTLEAANPDVVLMGFELGASHSGSIVYADERVAVSVRLLSQQVGGACVIGGSAQGGPNL